MLKYSQVISYSTERYPFGKVLAAVFRAPALDQLHLYYSAKSGDRSLGYEDNLKLRELLQKLPEESPFYTIYHKWIARLVAPHFGKRISYSAHPKMRVHLVGTGSVSEFHRDADVTGRPDQINCFLPFTDVFDTNSLWCESSYGLKDYAPINLKYGEALIWDGGFLEHGTVGNQTDRTRVSCDFRFSPHHPERVEAPWSEILAGRDLRVMPSRAGAVPT
jgi:hypothetical protein